MFCFVSSYLDSVALLGCVKEKSPHFQLLFFVSIRTLITTWSFSLEMPMILSWLTTEREHNMSAESILAAGCAPQEIQRRYRLWRWQFKVFKVIQTQEEWTTQRGVNVRIKWTENNTQTDLGNLEICRNSVSSLLSCALECIWNYLVQVDKKGNLWCWWWWWSNQNNQISINGRFM